MATDLPVSDHYIASLNKALQSKFFRPDRVSKWLEAVVRVDPQRVDWHIKRTYGFGGSEVGVLVAERAGIVDPFDSARNIVAGKLLLANPSEPIPAMERGQYMEDVIARVFYDKHKAYNAVRDEEAMRVMSKATGLREWQNGSPDDVVLMGTGKKKKRFILDYKAPGDGGYIVKGVPMRYAAQLHHYGMIAEQCKIPIDGYMLVAMDYKAWNLEVLPVAYDPELSKMILDAGDYYWHEYVMQDRLPDYGRKAIFDRSAVGDIDLLEKEGLEFLVRKRIADLLYAEAKKIQASMVSRLSQHKVGDAKLPLLGGLLDISAKPDFDVDSALEVLGDKAEEARIMDYDVEGLVAAAIDAGVDVEAFQRATADFDKQKLNDLMVSEKLNVEAFHNENLTMALARSKKGPVADRLSEVTDLAKAMLPDMVDRLRSSVEEHGLDSAQTRRIASPTP